MHLFEHLWELYRQSLMVHTSDESLQQGLDHINTSRYFHIVSWSGNHQNVFTHDIHTNIVYSLFGSSFDLIKEWLHSLLSLECW